MGLDGIDEGDFEPLRPVAWRCCETLRLASEASNVLEVICRRSMGGTAGDERVVELATGTGDGTSTDMGEERQGVWDAVPLVCETLRSRKEMQNAGCLATSLLTNNTRMLYRPKAVAIHVP